MSRSLLPTVTSSIGMLLGGLLGAAGGAFIGNESIVILLYAAGFVGGAVAGAMLGKRLSQNETCTR